MITFQIIMSRIVFKSDDGFVGNVKDMAEHFKTDVPHIYRVVYHDKTINDQHIKKIQDNRIKYMVINEGGIVEFIGTPQEIAKKYYVQDITVYGAYRNHRKMLYQYEIRRAK